MLSPAVSLRHVANKYELSESGGTKTLLWVVSQRSVIAVRALYYVLCS